MKKKPARKEISLVRSSAAEYLTFVAAQGEGGIEVVYADEDIWLTQKMKAQFTNVVAANETTNTPVTNPPSLPGGSQFPGSGTSSFDLREVNLQETLYGTNNTTGTYHAFSLGF